MALGEVIKKSEHSTVKFTGRSHPTKGIVSVVLVVLSLLLMLTMIILSALAGGQGEWYLGLGGLAALALAVTGFVLAIRCFRMDDIYYSTPMTGAILGGLLMLGELGFYVVGII